MNRPPKIDRKALKTPDQFVQRGTFFMDILSKYSRVLVALVVAVFVGIGAYYAWGAYSRSKLEKGWTAYYGASKKTGDERWKAFEQVYKDFGSTRAGYFAALALADNYFDEAKKEALRENGAPAPMTASAVDWYTKAYGFGGLETTEAQLILINRGEAKEVSGQIDEAILDYQAAADKDGLAKNLALLNLGRGFELKKQNDKAIESYEKVAKAQGDAEGAESEYVRLAKSYLRKLKSPLFQEKS